MPQATKSPKVTGLRVESPGQPVSLGSARARVLPAEQRVCYRSSEAYQSSALVRDRGEELAVFCKAWPMRDTTGRFTKTELTVGFDTGRLTCPNNVVMALLRERTKVEHRLAHIGNWQHSHARYRGTRKNLLDLRRAAVVHNLHVIARQPDAHALAT